jgi:glycosyltransferase involved in cell wall biosynthesis
MKLIFFAPLVLGGVHVYLRNLGFELQKYGIDFKIIYYGFTPIKLHTQDFERIFLLDRLDNRITHFHKLKSNIESSSAVIIANDSTELEMYNYFKLNNPLIFIMHGDNNHYKSLVKYPCIDKIFFVSRFLSEKYVNHEKLILSPIVENGQLKNIDLNKWIKVAFIGRLEIDKGANELSKINQYLNFEWLFMIPKNGSDLNFIDCIKNKRVFFDSRNKIVIQKLVDCNFLFFPSISEGFGIAVLESMKNGVIPIVKDINSGIMAELIDGENCIKYSNLEELSEKIVALIKNKDAYNTLRKKTFDHAINNFDNNKTINMFLHELSKVKSNDKKIYTKIEFTLFNILPNKLFRFFKKIKYAVN